MRGSACARVQVSGGQSSAQNHVVIAPVQHSANVLLPWLVLGIRYYTQGQSRREP